MSKEEVIALMKGSKSSAEWNKNCDKVKAEFNGYPSWWYKVIIVGGVLKEAESNW